jgi:hypothetical protein
MHNEQVIKFFNDVKDAFEKAIGTSSSVDQERDERSVENYVRQSANTNTTDSQIGGNIVSNTTEPDPKGDIAVQKSFPTVNDGTLVNQTTRPEGDVSVSDAPNNPGIVPNQETIPSSATSEIAPSRESEMNQPEKVTLAKGEKCPTCGAIAKGDDTEEENSMEKSKNCADCGKPLNMCMCMGKAVDAENPAEDAKETSANEKKEEVKKSLWGGAFAPRTNIK